ncbi:MAG: biotin carboxylase N-terminal domain-containing protein [Myxococcota bacterium]
MSFSSVLVANRGEIASRVFRTARALGYETVAVFSDADRDAPFVREADRAVSIGGAAPATSYLRADAIVDAARRAGADAIHPGYGFLAEDPAFARLCAERGITFIGPPPAAIAAMGNKAEAKAAMMRAGVPCVPGYGGGDGAPVDDAALIAAGPTVGFPLLVKAVAGGGGRGMRLAADADGLPEAIAGARREAKAAFGDDGLILERFIAAGRHIEIQVFADAHGHVIHLGERDCTTQRRRQKVIEEAPSPVVDGALRARMGADAVAAAQAIGYVGAGTVEFIVDESLDYYFLEMNTRLQVEHPVTEMVTGLDLVAWQLRIAAGESLPLEQSQVTWRGHAIEARLYAEDPMRGFAPQVGPVRFFRPPEQKTAGVGIRVDSGVAEGGAVTPHYDPMIAKVIAHGATREEAIRRLRRALVASPLFGVTTNGPFLVALLAHEDFSAHRLHTATLDEWSATASELLSPEVIPPLLWPLAVALLAQPALGRDGNAPLRSPAARAFDVSLESDDGQVRTYRWSDDGPRVTRGDDEAFTFEGFERVDAHTVRFALDGVWRRAHHLRVAAGELWIGFEGHVHHFVEPSAAPAEAPPDPRDVSAPVAGTLVALDVSVGDEVLAGARLGVIEAMKMETQLVAGAAGRVAEVRAQVGQQVEAGAIVVTLELEDG